MADLASTDITITILNNDLTGGNAPKRRVVATLAFGDSSLTYPVGGVPINKDKLGCPNIIESLKVFDQGTSSYVWTYDRTNQKLVARRTGSHTHNLLLKNAAVVDSAGARVNAGTDLLGANTGTDLTITGSGANGGVVAATANAAEPSAVAIAAQSLKIEVTGW